MAALDLVILEVGLGGRFDSVNAFDTDCAVITSIALDHMEYLGDDREAIGFEKAHIMRPGKPAIVSDPLPPASVLAHAERIGADLWLVGRDFNHRGDRQQWGWSGRGTALPRPVLPGAARRQPAAQRRRRASPRWRPCATGCRSPRRPCATGWRWSNCRAASRSCPASRRWCSTSRTTRRRWRRWRVNLDAMGFYPRTHAVFGAMRDKDIAGAAGAHGAAGRRLALLRPADAARRHAPPNWPPLVRAALAGRAARR